MIFGNNSSSARKKTLQFEDIKDIDEGILETLNGMPSNFSRSYLSDPLLKLCKNYGEEEKEVVNLILKPLLEIENSLTKALSEFSLVLMRFRVYVSPQNIASFEGSFNNGGDAMLEQIENTLKELKSAPREIKAIAEMYDEKILMLDTYVQLAIRYAPDIVKKPD